MGDGNTCRPAQLASLGLPAMMMIKVERSRHAVRLATVGLVYDGHIISHGQLPVVHCMASTASKRAASRNNCLVKGPKGLWKPPQKPPADLRAIVGGLPDREPTPLRSIFPTSSQRVGTVVVSQLLHGFSMACSGPSAGRTRPYRCLSPAAPKRCSSAR
jgi:hypothetical protein